MKVNSINTSEYEIQVKPCLSTQPTQTQPVNSTYANWGGGISKGNRHTRDISMKDIENQTSKYITLIATSMKLNTTFI